MAYDTAVTRSELGENTLQLWLSRVTLENFEPNLYFYKMGVKPVTPAGYHTMGWARFTTVDEDSITAGSTSTDGVSPTPLEFTSSVITVTPVQYRATISISDMVQELNVIDFLEGAAKELGSAMARRIDKVIQTTIMAGTNVIYGGIKTARSSLETTDILTAAKLNQASAILESRYAPKLDGFYVAFAHPFQIYDLRSESGTGNWLEVNKYTTSDKIFKGEIGMLNGVRVVMAPFIQKFTSTVDVYPCLVMGAGAYGVAEVQNLRTYYVGAVASDSDPAAQRRKVSCKIAFGTIILQQDSLLRIETGVTAIV